MREHLEYRRFRVWYCSLPAYPPTCLSSNLCIFTILTPTLTHSQAFVLMSPLPNHLSLPPLLSPSLLHTPFLFTGQQVLSGCVYSPPPLSYPSLSLRLSFPFSLCLFYVSLSLSLAAGKRREDAITAAHEGGWKKKKKKAHKANSSNPLRVVNSNPPNLWRFLTRQTEGKLLQSEDIRVSVPLALPGDLSHSEQSLRSHRVSLWSGLVACMRSIHLNPLTTI